MAVPVPVGGYYTWRDVPTINLPYRFELVDGVPVMMAPATRWHNHVMFRLADALTRQAPDGYTVCVELGIILSEDTLAEADIVICSGPVGPEEYAVMPDRVEVAVEIVSPGTYAKDRRLRPVDYAAVGIRYFWRVENEEGRAVIHTFKRAPGGGYVSAGVYHDRLTPSEPFPVQIPLDSVVPSGQPRR